MKRVSTILGCLILAVAAANAVREPFTLRNDYAWLLTHEDSVSYYGRILAPARQRLIDRGLTRLGYRVEPGANWGERDGEYFLIQYSLAPLVLRPKTRDDEWVLMNYSATKTPFAAPGLIPVEDLGNNLALYRRPELGRIWNEQEGMWKGRWVRRGDSGVFDAVWTAPGAAEIHDELVFESLEGREIVLYRKGTMGRYRGRLSEDGTKVEQGRADWFSPSVGWSASIEK